MNASDSDQSILRNIPEEAQFDPCATSTQLCMNGGECTNDRGKSAILFFFDAYLIKFRFYCNCKDKYYGKRCELVANKVIFENARRYIQNIAISGSMHSSCVQEWRSLLHVRWLRVDVIDIYSSLTIKPSFSLLNTFYSSVLPILRRWSIGINWVISMRISLSTKRVEWGRINERRGRVSLQETPGTSGDECERKKLTQSEPTKDRFDQISQTVFYRFDIFRWLETDEFLAVVSVRMDSKARCVTTRERNDCEDYWEWHLNKLMLFEMRRGFLYGPRLSYTRRWKV